MTWVKLSTGILTDPDIVGLSAEAFRTYVNGLAYCGENLTDGLITTKGLRVIRAEAVNELKDSGLWITAEPDGYVVRNYLDHQQSREQVEVARDKARKRAANRRSGGSSPEVRANYGRSNDEVRLQIPDEIPDKNPPTKSRVGIEAPPVDKWAWVESA